MIGDVTPVGWRAGETRRKRGWLRILLGVVLIVGGGVLAVRGIADTIGERNRIEDEAVARGQLGQPLSFEAAAGKYTVYVIFPGRFGNSETQERVIRRTDCEWTGGSFTGARQGSSVTLGQASTVGRFDAPAGPVEIACAGPADAVYVVTPGGGNLFVSVLSIVAGAFALAGGIGLLIWGLIGRRVPA